MTRRNFILLIIALFILLAAFFAAVYTRQTPGTNSDDEGFFANLNPFGRGSNTPGYTTPIYSTPTPEDPAPTNPEEQKLFKVSSMPVAGYGIFQKERAEKEFFPAVRYAARETGNIYQTYADEITERKFSSTLIPKVQEAFFANGADSVILRYIKNDNKTIQTFSGVLPKEVLGADAANSYELRGSFLPDNISELTTSRDGSKLFYLLNNPNSVSGTVLTLKDGKKSVIFESEFTEWLPVWNPNNTITLTTKPASSVLGYMYTLGTDKKFTKVLGGTNGLTTLMSPNGNLILYTDSFLSLSVYDTKTRESKPVGLVTEPEKCVWSKDGITVYCAVPKIIPGGLYPDSWYQGEISFSDRIWSANTQTGVTSLLIDPALVSGGEDVDGIKLSLDASETYLFFVNKKDSFLWKFDLK